MSAQRARPRRGPEPARVGHRGQVDPVAGQDGVDILDVLVERRAHDAVGLEGGVGVATLPRRNSVEVGVERRVQPADEHAGHRVTRARPLPAPSRSSSPAR